jgi:hypothetical protein
MTATAFVGGQDGRPGVAPSDLLVDIRNGLNQIAVLPGQSIPIRFSSVLVTTTTGTGTIATHYDAPSRVVGVASRGSVTTDVAFTGSAAGIGGVEIVVTGEPHDPGIVFQARVGSTLTPAQNRDVSIGSSAVFTGFVSSQDVSVSLDGLTANHCMVTTSTVPFTASADGVTANIVKDATVLTVVTFNVQCRSGQLDVVVSGLPATDVARLDVASPFDMQTLQQANGTASLMLVPHNAVSIAPAPVNGSDGRLYQATPVIVAVPSRATATALVHYVPPAASCSATAPLAWYPLDGNAQDNSGRANNGTIVGATTVSDRSGATGKALNFNGLGNHIDLGDRFNSLSLPFTVAMWLYRTPDTDYQPPGTQSDVRSLFATDAQAGSLVGPYLQFEQNNAISINYGDGTGATAASRRSYTSGVLQIGTWMHVAATVRGPTDMTLYVNGAPVNGTYSGTGGPLAHNSAPARIGSYPVSAAVQNWFGILDEVRIYDCSLSATDIRSLVVSAASRP